MDADFYGTISSIGDSHYIGATLYDPEIGWFDRILQVTFDAGGAATTSLLDIPTNGGLLSTFAGGLLVNSYNEDGSQSIHWYDLAHSQLQLLATSAPYGNFDQVFVGAGAGGSSTLYVVESVPGYGSRVIAVRSASIQSGSPAVVALPIVDAFQGNPTLLGDKLVYGEAVWTGAEFVLQFTVTDGSLAGTTTYLSPIIPTELWGNVVSEMVSVGTDVYFLYNPYVGFPTPTTLVSQVVKFDTIAGTFTTLASFFGSDATNAPAQNLTATEDGIYFTAWNEELGGRGIWAYDAAAGFVAVEMYASNPYLDPSQMAYIDGALYFAGGSVAVPHLDWNQPSYQAWVLRPAAASDRLQGDFNLDGIVNAADYTVWRDALGQTGVTPFSGADANGDGVIDSTDYQLWKANFGATRPTPAAGAGAVTASPDEKGDEASAEAADEILIVPTAAEPANVTAPPAPSTHDFGWDFMPARLISRPTTYLTGTGSRLSSDNHNDDDLLLMLAVNRASAASTVDEFNDEAATLRNEPNFDGSLAEATFEALCASSGPSFSGL
jgi:hypothetical protein